MAGLWPKRQIHYVLTRDLTLPVASFAVPTVVAPLSVARENSELMAGLTTFYAAAEFGADWIQRKLDEAAFGQALRSTADGTVAGAGLITQREFYVSEINRTFNCGTDGCYFFGDFVQPEFRGRRLQRLLVNRRVKQAAEAGIRWAFAIVDATNTTSLRSYYAENFVVAGRFRVTHWLGRRRETFRPLTKKAPCGVLVK